MGKNKMHLKKESAAQETKNLLTEDPVADREKDTILMKRGQRASIMKHMSPIGKYDHSYKMTGRAYDMEKADDKNLPMSERFHYLENQRHDADISKKGRRKKKKGGMFSGKFRSSDGRVKGSSRPTTSNE